MTNMLLKVMGGGYGHFKFWGYGNPNEVYVWGDGYAMIVSPDRQSPDGVWYLNTAGYAQKYDPARPPLSAPCEVRVLLVPQE